MKFNYPVPSHFQFSGRDGSGTWKKVRDGSGTGIPSDPGDDDDGGGDDGDDDDDVDLLCSLVDPGDLVVAVGHLDDVPHIVQRSE